jgi:hypothetical protein
MERLEKIQLAPIGLLRCFAGATVIAPSRRPQSRRPHTCAEVLKFLESHNVGLSASMACELPVVSKPAAGHGGVSELEVL